MGIFANPPDPTAPGWITPKPPVQPFNGETGFEALGRPVPFYRRSVAETHCRAMGMKDRERIDSLISRMCGRIERDDPHGAMEIAAHYLDVTGVYRLFAVLLTAERPADLAPEPEGAGA